MIHLEDLMSMNARALHQVLCQGRALDREQLANTQYLGVDLSLPWVARKLLWHTFRKTFCQDPDTDVLRGWNVRMQQTGVQGEAIPMLDRRGQAKTFGHYRVRDVNETFPGDWRGANFLDYTDSGNAWYDPAALGYTPLVAVNAGSQALLLGWEVLKIGPAKLSPPLYWALRLQGPLERIVARNPSIRGRAGVPSGIS